MIKKILAASIAISALSSGYAASVNGDVKFSIEIPEIIVLYHWDTAKLTLTGGSSAIADTRPHNGSAVLGTGPYDVTQNAIDTGTVTNNPNFGVIDVKLVKSWGVRSITTNNPVLTLTAPGATLKKTAAGTDSLTITNPILKCTTAADCSANGTATTPVVKGWAVKTGNIEFKIDLSNITAAGTYSSGGNNSATFNLAFATTP